MVLLTALWGFQQVTVKWIAADVSFVMQAAIRSIVATLLLLAWARWRGIALFRSDGTLWADIGAGLLFAAEFVFIYAGLGHTNASRMSVFVYLTPPLAFADGFGSGLQTFIGDLFGIIAAVFWASTTVLIRATRLAQATATKTLFYQLGVSALCLPLASVLMGEKGVASIDALTAASLAYQSIVVAFGTYLAWFWLLTRYLAARLSVLSFLTPLFGVLCGVLFLSEPLSGTFALAALLVGAGIVLVNLR